MYLFPLGMKCFIGTTGKVYLLKSMTNPIFLDQTLPVPGVGAGILTTKTRGHEEKGILCRAASKKSEGKDFLAEKLIA